MSTTVAAKRRFFDELAPRWDGLRPPGDCTVAVERGLALVEPLAGRTVVDLGCGTGLLEKHLLPRVGAGRIIAVDFSAAMLALARERHDSARVSWLCCDVLETALPDASVDVVVCFDAFPHFSDSAATARETARWLRPGGRVLVWHDIGREQLASIHRDLPVPVQNDLLPPVSFVAELFAGAGLDVERACEDECSYTLLARCGRPE